MWWRAMPQNVAIARGWMAGRPPISWMEECELVAYGVSSEYVAGAVMAARVAGLRREVMKGRGVKPPEAVAWVL
jgi:hypothetical protein